MKFTVVMLVLVLALCAPAAQGAWWDGFAAPPAGQGINGQVRVLHVHDGELFAGGIFNDAGGVEAWYVARWDSANWHDLDGGTDHRVDALCTWDDDLIAGGRFVEAGGVSVAYVARWDGLDWAPVGDPAAWTRGYVLSLAVHDGDLYAGGTNYVARWDGLVWSTITGAAFSGDVFALASYAGELYAAGAFASMVDPGGGSVTALNIARWDGVGWSAVGAGANGTVYALSPHGDDLAAGGIFTSPDDLVAAWTGTTWYAPGGGLDGTFVTALGEWSGRLIAGGDVTGSGGILFDGIAQLGGSGWAPLGDGVNDMVRAVAGIGGSVYIGGDFVHAGGLPSVHVGRWDDPGVGIGDAPPAADAAILSPPFPNPANPRVTIPLRIATRARVRVAVYDLQGRLVRRLWNGVAEAGTVELHWDGTTDDGRTAPSGGYLARATTRAGSSAVSVTLVR